MAERYPTISAGQRITASLLTSMLPQTVRKTADTSRSSTTTVTADPHLQSDADANAVYTVHGFIKYEADTAVDLSIRLSGPSGSLGEWASSGVGNPVVGSTAAPALTLDTTGARGYMIRTESADLGVSRTHGGLGVGSVHDLLIFGTVRVGSTSGTIAIEWAQSASSATATILYTDSWLCIRRIA